MPTSRRLRSWSPRVTRPRLALALALACSLAVPSCGSCERADGVVTIESLGLDASERETLAGLERLGDGGALVVVLRPSRVAALRERASPVAAALPGELQAAVEAAGSPSAWPALALTLLGDMSEEEGRPIGESAPPPALRGWDHARPVLLSLMEPPRVGPPGAVAAQLLDPGGSVGALRHQVLIPASDPQALASTLASLLDQRFTRESALTDDSSIVARWSVGASGWIAFTAEPDWIHVYAGTHERAPSGFLGDPRSMQSRAVSEPIHAPARTPAAVAMARGDAVAAALVRPPQLRALVSWHGALQMQAALASVTPQLRQRLTLRGLELVLRGELMMADAGAELDELALLVSVEGDELALRTVSSLTTHGATVLDAAVAGRGAAPALRDDVSALVDVAVQLDAGAIAERVRDHPTFPKDQEAGELARAFAECGPGCSLYLSTRAPAATLAGVLRFTPQDPDLPLERALPRSLRGVLTGIDEGRPRGAIAAELPKAFAVDKLRALIESASRRGGLELTLESEARGELQRLLLGVNVDPYAVFSRERDETLPEGQLGRARVELASLRERPEARAAAAALGLEAPPPAASLRAATWRVGRATVSELRLALGESPAGALEAPRWAERLGRLTREEPASESPGEACLAEAAAALTSGLRERGRAEPARGVALMREAFAAAASGLTCAEQHESTRAASRGLRRAVVVPLVDELRRAWRHEEARELLSPHCEATEDELLCGQLRALKQLPEVALPRPVTRCESLRRDEPLAETDHQLLVTADGRVLLDDVPVEGAALAAKLDAGLGSPLLDAPGGDIALAFAGEATLGQLAPTLEVLARSRLDGFFIVVAGADGPQTIPVAAPLRPPRSRALPPIDGLEQEVEASVTVALDGGAFAVESSISGLARPRAELSAAARGRALSELRALAPDASVSVRASASTPWSSISDVLVGTCPNARLVHG